MFGQLEPKRGCVDAAVADASHELELESNVLEKSVSCPSKLPISRERAAVLHPCVSNSPEIIALRDD